MVMDKLVAQLNIEHFRRKLAEETDKIARETLRRLLAAEHAKLQALLNRKKAASKDT